MLSDRWAKSTHSGVTNENHCLEAHWRKSRRSANNGACLEARQDGMVQVRDSKDTAGPVLSWSPAAWTSFLANLKL